MGQFQVSNPSDSMKNPSIEQIRSQPWLNSRPREAFERAQLSLLTMRERQMLFWLASEWYTGQGAIVDLGSFLGSSTVAFADGLRMRDTTIGHIHAYDLFRVSRDQETQRFLNKREGDSFLENYQSTICGYEDLITTHPGDIKEHPWTGGPIEILFVDLAKSWEMNEYIISSFYPHLIPGRSIIVHQDFGNSWNPWLPVSMGYLREYFEMICDECPSRVYHNGKAVPGVMLNVSYKKELDRKTRLECMRFSLQASADQMRFKQHGAMAILLFIEDGKDTGIEYLDTILTDPELPKSEKPFLETVRRTIDIWNLGWAYEQEMATKF